MRPYPEVEIDTPAKMPLQRAVLCVSCETVSAAVHVCPGCGDTSLLSLARVLVSTEDDSPVLVAELIPELLAAVLEDGREAA